MEIIDELSQKVHQAAKELVDLKKERQQIYSELELLRNQQADYQSMARENEKMKRDQDQLRTRLQRLQKKIDKHLLVETTLSTQGGGSYEEHPQ